MRPVGKRAGFVTNSWICGTKAGCKASEMMRETPGMGLGA